MARITTWKTDEEASKELRKRLEAAMMSRKDFERQWELNEKSLLNTDGQVSESSFAYADVQLQDDVDGTMSRTGVNKNLKNLRLIHSQMSANPPTVIPRPNSSDSEDKRRADAADRLIRHAMRKYRMAENFDQLSFHTLLYGSGFIKTMWDTEKGEILDVDDNGEILMEGDFGVTVPSPWNILPDSDATKWDDARYVFEGYYVPYEQACYMFPDKKELLESVRRKSGTYDGDVGGRHGREAKLTYKSDSIYIYEYWEKGLPVNGMVGRHCWCLPTGEVLSPVSENPHQFKRPLSRIDSERIEAGEDVVRPSRAYLPYHLLTDIDLPNTYWGASVLNYANNLQEKMNHLDSVTLEAIEAHGVPRMILPEGTEISDESISNSPLDIVRITGNQPPYFMENMKMPVDVTNFREKLALGIDDMWGVNESMFGQQSRETSGFSMQYATNQGNMIRRRLFNKYILTVEDVYKSFLNIVRENWDESRTVHAIGKENAFEVVDIAGADIDGGFDIVVEYGASLSLDPVTRREEILTLMPVFEKAGVSPRSILNMLKLTDTAGLFDRIELANSRQREIFETIVATGKQIQPQELEDHRNMLAFAYDYIMTAEYKYLNAAAKQLIFEHVKLREEMAAAQQPPPPPMGGMPPMGGGGMPPLPGMGG